MDENTINERTFFEKSKVTGLFNKLNKDRIALNKLNRTIEKQKEMRDLLNMCKNCLSDDFECQNKKEAERILEVFKKKVSEIKVEDYYFDGNEIDE